MTEIKIQIEIQTKMDQSGKEAVETWWEQKMPFSWQTWSKNAEVKKLITKLKTTPEDLALYFLARVKGVREVDMFERILREIDLRPKKIKVFQVFNLDLEEMNKVEQEKLLKLNLLSKRETLTQELKARGYEVLNGFSFNGGIPTSLIVAGKLPSDRNLKGDFYSIAERLRINWFTSGEVYQEIV